MKSKGLIIITIIITLGISFAFLRMDIQAKERRIHQHLENQWQDNTVKESDKFQTHLPIVSIDTLGQVIPGAPKSTFEEFPNELFFEEEYEEDDEGKNITGSFSVIDLQKGNNSLEDKPTLNSLAELRIRGNSSRYFDKKSYAVNLVIKDGSENKKEVAGMSAHNKWVLNGPFLDRSLLRNYVTYNISGQIMEYSPNVRYCELFIDNEYQGVYLLMETPSKGKGRIDISKPEKNNNITDYIIRLDRKGKGDHEINDYSAYTYRNGVSGIDVRYPGSAKITEGLMSYIEDDISKLQRILYSYDLTNKKDGYTQYIDLNSFAEYYVINEFFGDSDAGRFSTFYYKSARGKLKTAVWDFNNSCNNYIDYEKDQAGFSMLDVPLFDVLIKDKKFIDAVVAKYRDLRKDVLSEEYLLNYIDETNLWLGDAVDRNYEKWGYVFDLANYNGMNYLTPVERNYTSHEESVEQMKDYIEARGDWLDRNIDVLYQYCHESKIKDQLIR